MATPSLAVTILAAGKGKRMKSDLPKVLFELCGKPALSYPIQAVSPLMPDPFLVVVGWGAERIKDAFCGAPVEFLHQAEQLGTGHALLQARERLAHFQGDLLVLYGDGPLIRTETLEKILRYHREQGNTASLLTAEQENPTGYGRIVRGRNGEFLRIVEERDADPAIRRIKEVNTGITVYRCPEVFDFLVLLKNDNAQGEYYLTDLPEQFMRKGCKVGVLLHDDPKELDGFNSLEELADLNNRLSRRLQVCRESRRIE